MIIANHLKTRIRRNLLTWYHANKRMMPWRGTDDPYKIWISEVMLQQTQVATAIDYYQHFVHVFPTVQHLAAATPDSVMKVWENLGYYGRARNLHQAARDIINHFNGQIPDQIEELLSLPGIGLYTAGAILSIGFGKRVPVLDGNVIRVLTRLFHITDNTGQAAVRNELLKLAESLLPVKNVRHFNEAMMELGAVLCKPRKPICAKCPFTRFCEANRLSIQEELPVKAPRKPVPHYHVVAGVIWNKNQFLITRRKPKGLLGGLWEFPGGKVKEGETYESALTREILEELAIKVKIIKPMISIPHAYTHFKITLHLYECQFVRGKIQLNQATAFRWIKHSDLNRFAFPAANRKAMKMLYVK